MAGTIDNSQEHNKTPLKLKLNNIADLIGHFGLGIAIATLIALIIRMIINYCTKDDFEWFGMIKKFINDYYIMCFYNYCHYSRRIAFSSDFKSCFFN